MPRVAAIFVTIWPALLAFSVRAVAAEPSREQINFFEQKIRPVLVQHCYKCHSGQSAKIRGGLLLDTRAGMLQGGDSGPAVVPGDASASLLFKAIRFDEREMPPDGKLPNKVIEDFRIWIQDGAADPRGGQAAKLDPKSIDIEAGKLFWAFQGPQARTRPDVRNRTWPRTKLDYFLLAKLEGAGHEPNAAADRRTWIRRVCFDLTGLPPSPEDVEAFVSDRSPRADENLVDLLLASPRYGEHWARFWLDLARYAEDQAHIVGSDQSLTYPNAYLYRDWVIGALNDDLPYDRFIRLQLAADLFAPNDSANLAALGFLGLGPKYYGRGSQAVMADEWEDRVDTVCRGLLGLTVACARCHNHKFDPIPTEDYYGLAGVFASTKMFNRALKGEGEARQPREAMHVVCEGKSTDLNVFIRGDAANKGALVPRHFLQVLCDSAPPPFHEGSGRRELAEAIASPHNPLTARVLVNRIWAQHFGRPIVGTPSNFGAMGELPTHPELLDDLAVRFMENGWSLKWLQREIVLSAAYRQSSASSPGTDDPENRLLGHMNRRRLSVEMWRDAILVAIGKLDGSIGGRSIDPQDPLQCRRTIYSAVSRLDLNRLLALFDYPDPNAHADRRLETTTPLQKMFVLNSPFMVAQAAALAERLLTEDARANDRSRIERAYRLLYSRPATAKEIELGLAFLHAGDEPAKRWQQYAHVLLAANEMMFID